MTTWSPEQVNRIGRAEELELASRKPDETFSRFTTMWVVRVGDHLCVRSAYGPDSTWYRRARTTGRGRVRAGGIERNVAFTDIPPTDTQTHAAIDQAYHDKYDRYGLRIVGSVIGRDAATVTLRLEPHD